MTSRLLYASAIAILVAGCSAPASPPAPAPRRSAPAVTPAPAGPVAPPTTDEDKIASAMSAAPDAVAKDATILDMNEKMEMRTLRPGTNGWTCLPDMPVAGRRSRCAWTRTAWSGPHAWMTHKDPPKDKMAIGYMLAGGSDASNTDPFATKPNDGQRVGRHRSAPDGAQHRRPLRRLPDDARQHEGAVRHVGRRRTRTS